MYLVRAGHDAGKSRFPYPLGERLPAAEGLERLTFRLYRLRVPDLDFRRHRRRDLGRGGMGSLLGLGSQRDLGVHLVGRVRRLSARPSHAEREADDGAWIAVLAWGTMLMNLFGVNIFFEGLHSYADID